MILKDGYVHGGDIYRNRVKLDFSANVNPLGTPETVTQAVCDASKRIDVYPDPYCGPLRERLAVLHGVSPDEIICGNGAAEIIYQFAQVIKPKKALLPVPSFADYEFALAAADCEPVLFPLLRAESFEVNGRILNAITPETDCVMLANPNNPTGKVIDPALLLRILQRCRETGTWLFLDECFYDLTDDGKAYSLVGALAPGDRVLILRAFTKAYGMAGLRLGYAVSRNSGLLRDLSRVSQPWNVSTVAQAAGLAALGCTEWTRRARELIGKEKAYLLRELSALGITVLEGDANYLLLSDAPGLYEKLLRRGILVRDCANYHGLCGGDCRIAVRTHEENTALIAAIREVRYE